MATTTGFSLEPPPVIAYDGKDDDLFAPRARLLDVTDEGLQVFTRSVPRLHKQAEGTSSHPLFALTQG